MLGGTTSSRLMCGAAAVALVACAGAAHAEDLALNIAPQPLTSALKEFGVKTGRSVLYGPALADAKQTRGVGDAPDAEAALTTLLEGTGLSFRRNGDTFLIVQGGSGPQSSGAGGTLTPSSSRRRSVKRTSRMFPSPSRRSARKT